MSLKYWFKNIKKKKQIKKDIKYFKGNKESVINYQEYYTKIYNHYNEIKNINTIRKIEIEQTRIKGQLEKNNNPGNALFFSLIAVVFSLLANLFFSSLNIKDNYINLILQSSSIIVLIFIAINTSLDIAVPYRDEIQFYTTALDVLEDMKKKKLKERKYKKRR
ncbi:TPA: hypothetical protein ACGI8N_002965 [Clostridioides difficile]|uniref:hypothetical protein n=1 Tax=Clostridioides difficile TaxID=1496 RepID=UPI00097FD2E0|nr:hypothetical protein [Clostridioides difficile]MDV9474925.1 hypothetical protein [Clostridioides difficile]MDV9929371.1 hypothetical protein [Clostridioides difficile]MDV9989235.1 hypothetical protein [Clostridioides difficile]SJO89716.1 Uncharacterised protein [Clostridioides difficile]